jgi:hypothetical protein
MLLLVRDLRHKSNQDVSIDVHSVIKLEASGSRKTLIPIYQASRHHIQHDSSLQVYLDLQGFRLRFFTNILLSFSEYSMFTLIHCSCHSFLFLVG